MLFLSLPSERPFNTVNLLTTRESTRPETVHRILHSARVCHISLSKWYSISERLLHVIIRCATQQRFFVSQ